MSLQSQSQSLQQLLNMVQSNQHQPLVSSHNSNSSMSSLLSSLGNRNNTPNARLLTGFNSGSSSSFSTGNSAGNNSHSALELLLLQKLQQPSASRQGNWSATSTSNPPTTGLAQTLLQEAQRESERKKAEQELLQLKIRLLQAQAQGDMQQQQQQSLSFLATHTHPASVSDSLAPSSYSSPRLSGTDEMSLLQQVLRETVASTSASTTANANAEQTLCAYRAAAGAATAPPSPSAALPLASHDTTVPPSPRPEEDVKVDTSANVTQDLLGPPRKGRAIKFPQTLHSILTSLEQEGKSHIASFTPDGKGFVVHNPEEFVKGSLSHHFQSSNYASFQRQINLYCFHRTKQGIDNVYSHPSFQRDQPDLCLDMVRTKIKKTPFQQQKKKQLKAAREAKLSSTSSN